MNINVLDPKKPLVLTPYPNGGWVIEQPDTANIGVVPERLGAYSSAEDMLQALDTALAGEE